MEKLNPPDIDNKKLDLALKLYNYYEKFKQKMSQNNNPEEKYFLIKKEIMNDVKKDINYDLIIQILREGKFNETENLDKKQKLFVLDNFPKGGYDKYFKSKKIEKRLKDYISPNEISIAIPNTQNESIHIYDNFEIIEPQLANEFINNIYEKSSQNNLNNIVTGESYIECTLKDGQVIVNYPKEKFKNNKYIYVIGSMDKENTFKAEYILIYRKDHSFFENMKNKLNNYLQTIEPNLKFGPYPLINNKYEEIGIVIGLNQIHKSNIKNINNNQNQPINIDKKYNNKNKKKNEGYNNQIINQQDNSPNNHYLIDINEYNLDSQFQFTKINDCFNIPPLIGLDNIGASCYMNAILQCLCNIPELVNYFKYNKTIIPTKEVILLMEIIC